MPDVSAALREYQGYRYTVTIIANGGPKRTTWAELWWQRLDDTERRWHYFRRHVAATVTEAVRGLEADFCAWVEGQSRPRTSKG